MVKDFKIGRAARTAAILAFAALAVFGHTTTLNAQKPPTPEESRLIQEHKLRNKGQIAEGERKVRQKSIEQYLTSLSATGNKVWVSAIHALRPPAEEGTNIFLQLLKHPNPEVVAEAIYSLKDLYDADILAPLLNQVMDCYARDQDLVAYEAASFVAKIGVHAEGAPPQMVAGLSRVSLSRRARVRTVQALGAIGMPAHSSAPMLSSLVTQPDLELAVEAVRARAAVTGLAPYSEQRLKEIGADKLADVDYFGALLGIRKGGMPWPRAIAALTAAVKDSGVDSVGGLLALETLGTLSPDDAESARLILKASADRDPFVQRLGLAALNQISVGRGEVLRLFGESLLSTNDDFAITVAMNLKRWDTNVLQILPEIGKALDQFTGESDANRLGTLLEVVQGLGSGAASLSPHLEPMVSADSKVFQGMGSASVPFIRGFLFLVLAEMNSPLRSGNAVLDALANSRHGIEFAGAARCVRLLPKSIDRNLVVKSLARALARDFRDELVNSKGFARLATIETIAQNTTTRIEAIRALMAIGPETLRGNATLLEERSKDPLIHSPLLSIEYPTLAREALNSITGK